MTTRPSRGIRNNNPGNIRIGDPWQGLTKTPQDTEFCSFQTPAWGIRALVRTLISYQDKYKIRTIEGIIKRWAPDIENDTESYIKSVEKNTGYSRLKILDLHDYDDALAVAKAIILHENGNNPYDDKTFEYALAIAGVKKNETTLMVKDTKSEQSSQKLQQAGLAGVTIGAVCENAGDIVQLTGNIQSLLKMGGIAILLGGIVVLGIIYYKNIKDFINARMDENNI